MKKIVFSLVAVLTLGFTFGQGITVWTAVGDAELEWMQAEAASFEGVFGVAVEIVKVDFGEMNQKMLLSAPEGEAADLIAPMPHDRIGELAVGGVVADMSGFATPDYLSELNSQAQLGVTFNGKLL